MLVLIILYFLNIISKIYPLLCYNGTFTNWSHKKDPLASAALFGPSRSAIARTRCSLTVSCARIENAMCFVRSWTARSHHAWIVQRGCYQVSAQDTLPRTMTVPTRAMSCKYEKYADAEYKVCLCQADWCNSASTFIPSVIQYLTKLPICIIANIIAIN